MWALAEWMAARGRKEADATAGEEIPFKNDKSKAKKTEGVVAPDVKCIAPLFNLVSLSYFSLAARVSTDIHCRRTIPISH